MDIVVKMYDLSLLLPDEEKYGLKSQMRRSAVSIPSNIAEGCSRPSEKAFSYFVEVALGSAFELETQLLLSQRIGYFRDEHLGEILPLLSLFERKGNALLSKLKDRFEE